MAIAGVDAGPARIMTDEEMLDVLRRAGPVTMLRYDHWRLGQVERTPTAHTIKARFGTWAQARALAFPTV